MKWLKPEPGIGPLPIPTFVRQCFSSVVIDRCPADLDFSGGVGITDFLDVLLAWGPYDPCPPFIAADIDLDCEVGITDFLLVLSNWGPCPGDPTGACCFYQGCQDGLTRDECVAQRAVYRTDGTTCAKTKFLE